MEHLRWACASLQSDQSLMGALWVAKGPVFFRQKTKTDQTANVQTDLNLHNIMGESLQDYEADFPQKVSLKMLN